MDVAVLWQEHKRFLSIVGAGTAVFLIAYFVIDGRFSARQGALESSLRGSERALRDERYGPAELAAAEEDNATLDQGVASLAKAVAFETRPRFRFDESGDTTQYFVLHSQVNQELATLASKSRIVLPPGLDLEDPETAQVERIIRHLEALDLVDRVLRLAIESKVKRVQGIRVQLDSGLNSRNGVGEIETTAVEFDFRSPATGIVRLLSLSQSEAYGKPLTLSQVEMVGAKSKEEEVTAKVTFLVVRLHGELLERALAEGN